MHTDCWVLNFIFFLYTWNIMIQCLFFFAFLFICMCLIYSCLRQEQASESVLLHPEQETADLPQRKYWYYRVLEPNPPFVLQVRSLVADACFLDVMLHIPCVVLHSYRATRLPLCSNCSRFVLYIWFSNFSLFYVQKAHFKLCKC